MDIELERAYRFIMDAEQPEQLFGGVDIVLPPRTLIALLDAEAARFTKVVAPESYQNPVDVDGAKECSERLQQLRDLAVERILDGVYALPSVDEANVGSSGRSFSIGKRQYVVGTHLGSGSVSKHYRAALSIDGKLRGSVFIKVATDELASSQVRHESSVLTLLHGKAVPQWKHLPLVIDRFETNGRAGLVQRLVVGLTLGEARALPRYRHGIDQRHMVWILDRLLSCLGFVHRLGVVHGTLNPDHVLLQPSSHNAVICGWSGAALAPAKTGQRVVPTGSLFEAPEVGASGQLGPWTDLYSVGRLMVWLLGGDPVRGSMPDQVAEPIQRLLRSLIRDDARHRPSDAWEVAAEATRVKDSLWERKFLPFETS